MATISTILNTKRPRKDETYPIVFRLRIKKQYMDIASGFSCRKDLFVTKTATIKKDALKTEQLRIMKEQHQANINKFLTLHIDEHTLNEYRNFISKTQIQSLSIKEFWKQEIDKMMAVGKLGNARTYKITLSALSNVIDLTIPFHRLTHNNLKEIEHQLMLRNVSINSISVYLRTLRAICNRAIEKEITSSDWYPFKKYIIKKERTTPKVLSLQELKSYFALSFPVNHTYYKSHVIGALIFFLRGINLHDLLLLKKDNIKAGRIIYKRAKTGKICSIFITPEIQSLLSLFNSTGSTLLGMITDAQLKDKTRFSATIQQKNKVINSHLKKIGESLGTEEKITTYTFRYSYSNAAKRLNFSKDLISEALTHSYGNSTTSIYLEQYDLAIIDDMNQQIIDAVM